MAIPGVAAAAMRAAVGFAANRFVARQLAPLQLFLAARLGPAGAAIGAAVLATALAAAFMARQRGKSPEEVVRAALSVGVGEAVAKGIARFLRI
ncbi:MAG: hypothetical protein GVY13_13615 [Alphaproteobacteria bacterium]|jgi:hypothetical protein|nr:hypothetical protein [Alphaproteobacteria bacterium]